MRLLSKERRCAIHVKAESLARHLPFIDTEHIQGSSPPGVFVGRFGYPNVLVGPMVPPKSGDTQILDTPEWWLGKNFEEIVDFRFGLVRGYSKANIHSVKTGGKLIETLQEVAMTTRPMDTELLLSKKPNKVLDLSEDSQPFGPIAPLASFKTSSNGSVDRRIEDAFYDKDLKASDAVFGLFKNNVLVTRIQRAFSMGMFGIEKNRKLVPTRWSITAVDSNLGLKLIDEIKAYETIDEYRVYKYSYLDNVYVAIFTPEKWKFEWIEAWFEPELLATSFPETNFAEDVVMSSYTSPEGYVPAMLGDYEGYWGRKTYAKPGGCYYATRLSVAEYLNSIRRQAGAIMLREIHPGYIMPVGVWNCRESIRALLRTEYERFDTLDSALNYACTILEIPKKSWIEASGLLREGYFQRKISEFAKG
jgi:hypothetical protein